MTTDPLLNVYGIWHCVDGREVLFNRRYRPIWQRQAGKTSPADPRERVEFIRQAWFHSDRDPPRRNIGTRRRLRLVVRDFLAGLPIDAYIRSNGPRPLRTSNEYKQQPSSCCRKIEIMATRACTR